MPESDGEPEDLTALVAEQRELIVKLHDIIAHQATLIEELQEAAGPERKGRRRSSGATYQGLSARVEAILGLALSEAAESREQARQDAAERIAAAEQEAARIRAAARDSGTS